MPTTTTMTTATPRLRTIRRHHPVTGPRDVGHLELAEVTQQPATAYVGEPIRVGAGVNVMLSLNVSEIVGTLDVLIETAEKGDETAAWRRFGAFTTASGPTHERIGLACADEFLRLTATPGNASGQIATYNVTGTVIGL